MTLLVLATIASLCGGNRDCVREVRQCYDGQLAMQLSYLNVCQKTSMWSKCDAVTYDGDAEEIYRCWLHEKI